MDEKAIREVYKEDFQFLFVLMFVLFIATMGWIINASRLHGKLENRIEAIERLNGVQQNQEPCGSRK